MKAKTDVTVPLPPGAMDANDAREPARIRGKKDGTPGVIGCRLSAQSDANFRREAARINSTPSALLTRAAEEFIAKRCPDVTPAIPRQRGAGYTRVWARLGPDSRQFVDAYAAREQVSRSAAVEDLLLFARAQKERSVPEGEAARLLEMLTLIEGRTEAMGRACGAIQLLLVNWAAKSEQLGTPDPDVLLAELQQAGNDYWDAIEDGLGRKRAH